MARAASAMVEESVASRVARAQCGQRCGQCSGRGIWRRLELRSKIAQQAAELCWSSSRRSHSAECRTVYMHASASCALELHCARSVRRECHLPLVPAATSGLREKSFLAEARPAETSAIRYGCEPTIKQSALVSNRAPARGRESGASSPRDARDRTFCHGARPPRHRMQDATTLTSQSSSLRPGRRREQRSAGSALVPSRQHTPAALLDEVGRPRG